MISGSEAESGSSSKVCRERALYLDSVNALTRHAVGWHTMIIHHSCCMCVYGVLSTLLQEIIFRSL